MPSARTPSPSRTAWASRTTTSSEPHDRRLATPQTATPKPQAEAALAQAFRASKAGRYGLRSCRRRVGRSTLGRYDGNVYEAIYDEARKSPLNGKRMAGWDKFSQVLDVDFLKDVSTATMVHLTRRSLTQTVAVNRRRASATSPPPASEQAWRWLGREGCNESECASMRQYNRLLLQSP